MVGGMHGGACISRMAGACMAWGHAWLGRDGHCSVQYVSYWNAFLFIIKLLLSISKTRGVHMQQQESIPVGCVP